MDNKVYIIIIVALGLVAGGEAVYFLILQPSSGSRADLQNEYDQLLTEYNSKVADNGELIDDLNSLQDEHVALKNEHFFLQENFTALQGEDALLLADYEVLMKSNSNLEDDHEALHQNYDDLESTYTAYLVEYDVAVSEKEAVESEFQTLSDNYARVMDEVNIRLGLGADRCQFITSGEESIVVKMLQIVKSYGTDKVSEQWSDIRRLFDWTYPNIELREDSMYPRLDDDPSVSVVLGMDSFAYPKETLSKGYGDHEDQACLLVSMMKAYNISDDYWVVMADTNGSTACSATIITKGRLAIMDACGGYHTGMEIGQFFDYPVEYALDKWFAYWGGNDIRITCAFNDASYEAFDTTEEFIDWVYHYG